MGNEIVKLIFERKMSDAKDLIDESLNKKLAGVIGEGLEKVVSEKLDPVGKEDDDIDNDGDSDESDDYLRKRRKAIGKAMNTRKGMNEMQISDRPQDGRGMRKPKPSGPPSPQAPGKPSPQGPKGPAGIKDFMKRKIDSRSIKFKRLTDDVNHIEEGAPDTELDHHRGKNPDIFDQDYLPMKKGGKTFKAKSARSSGGY